MTRHAFPIALDFPRELLLIRCPDAKQLISRFERVEDVQNATAFGRKMLSDAVSGVRS